MLLRVYHAGRAFAFGYFFGLGLLALAHYATGWPGTYDEAGELALLIGAGALAAWLAREHTGRRTPAS